MPRSTSRPSTPRPASSSGRRARTRARTPLRRALLALVGTCAVVLLPVSAAVAAPAGPAVLPADSGIEPYAPYQAQNACDPVARAGVLRFRDLVLAAYPGTGDSGIVRSCSVGAASEHKEGRAWDWRVSASNPDDVLRVEDLLSWLQAPDELGRDGAMARRLGVMYVIWDSHIWKSYQASRGWQPYSGSSPHTDHVHFSFGWAGALAQTSYWSGRVSPVLQRPVPPPTASTSDTATVTIGTEAPVADRRAVVERRRTAVKGLPGPWRRH